MVFSSAYKDSKKNDNRQENYNKMIKGPQFVAFLS
jgi:hypothetical protein